MGTVTKTDGYESYMEWKEQNEAAKALAGSPTEPTWHAAGKVKGATVDMAWKLTLAIGCTVVVAYKAVLGF